ncbi:hypothetical protein E2C01_100765 [Portunus trituberculatus]|uniref:Uncharacterized protein n=1 Tax=Portunus trituberculatus TaxID=210409 RepID=A0A5B7KE57_PORTR|nr:hypothetical protein [Portunus trituberculatus]
MQCRNDRYGDPYGGVSGVSHEDGTCGSVLSVKAISLSSEDVELTSWAAGGRPDLDGVDSTGDAAGAANAADEATGLKKLEIFVCLAISFLALNISL